MRLLRFRPNRFILAMTLWMTLSCGNIAFAQEKSVSAQSLIDFSAFRQIAVLQEGRVKPLDSYARNILLQFSGKRTFDRKPAIDWLAKVLFTPEKTRADKIFLINNPETANALGLTLDAKRRYSFDEIEENYHALEILARKADAIEAKDRSIVENELLRVFGNVQVYLGLSQSMQFALPHPDFEIQNNEIKALIGLPEDRSDFSFLDIALKANALWPMTDALEGKDRKAWSALEKQTFGLVANLYQWSTIYQNMPLNIVAPLNPNNELWFSPWDAIASGLKNETIRSELSVLGQMTLSYRQGNSSEFTKATQGFIRSIQDRAGHRRALKFIGLEVFNNDLNPFLWSQMFYLLGLILICSSFILERRILNQLSLGIVVIGVIPHLFALVSRIVILARPPITNLYETFIFVGLICVVLGLIVEGAMKNRLGTFIAAFSGTVLLIIAGKFSADGDTLKMLVAVLNSNFWLGVHVPNITMGYAACCVAGLIGHIYLIQVIIHPKNKKQLEGTMKVLLGVLGLGLTLSFFGTMLGGIWADQSWGRFWGWDPKENGALMIVLWCAIIFHARISKFIGALGTAVASGFLLPIVAWAWFGVNLLSVGLHSYGFTAGVANGFAAFIIAETLFLTIGGVVAFRKVRHGN